MPGYPQLMRPCDIDGQLTYHLTTFFEKGGIVTVFAFDQACPPEGKFRLVERCLVAGHHRPRRTAADPGVRKETGARRGPAGLRQAARVTSCYPTFPPRYTKEKTLMIYLTRHPPRPPLCGAGQG